MPAPVVEFPVVETSAGRRIFTGEAEAVFNGAFQALFDMLAAIPAGPQGERGATGDRGERWVIGTPQPYAEGIAAVVGNVVYRRFTGSAATGMFRALQPTTITAANFPTSLVSNAAWELILVVPDGARGPQGDRGPQGLQGEPGDSSEIVEFPTDAQAIAYSLANPLALVISNEGM